MKIGIVGVGVVGSAIKAGFENIGHEVLVHDIKLETTIYNVLPTDLIYICLPTNSDEEGNCDISLVESTLWALNTLKYKGVVAVKSTIIPGTFKKLKKIFDPKRLCHVPEFLRAAHAYEDFTEKHNILVIGSPNKKCSSLICKSHGNYPKNVLQMKPQEAEFVKYYSNVFKAVKIIFANSFGKICDKFDIDYNKVLEAYELENVGETNYLKYFKNGGFGGMCLPKDVRALSKLAENENIDVNLFKFILKENKKFI